MSRYSVTGYRILYLAGYPFRFWRKKKHFCPGSPTFLLLFNKQPCIFAFSIPRDFLANVEKDPAPNSDRYPTVTTGILDMKNGRINLVLPYQISTGITMKLKLNWTSVLLDNICLFCSPFYLKFEPKISVMFWEFRAHDLSLLKLVIFIDLYMFYYGKEDPIPRGCELRSFRMENTNYFLKHLLKFQSKPLCRDQTLLSRSQTISMFGLRTWTLEISDLTSAVYCWMFRRNYVSTIC